MKTQSTHPQNLIVGLLFFILSVCLPVISMLPNKALAEDTTPAGFTITVDNAGADVAPSASASVTPDDIEKRIEEALDKNINIDLGGEHDGGAAILIPILAILTIFGLPPLIFIVWIISYFRNKQRTQQQRAETIARLLEAGHEVPKELLLGEESMNLDANSSRYKGLRNLGLGVGLAICLGAIISPAAGTIGLVLIGLGAAQLISSRTSGGKAQKPQDLAD